MSDVEYSSGAPRRPVASSSLLRRLQSAVRLHQNGDYAAAERAYRQILEEAPANVDALHLLGVIEGQKGNHEGARALIVRSLQLHPRQPLAQVNLAKLCLELGQPEQALAGLEQVLRLEPLMPEALYLQALALRALGRRTEALVSLERVIEARASNLDAWIQHGSVLLELGQAERALQSFEEAMRRGAGHADVYCARARALLELNRAGEALLSCEQALRQAPNDVRALRLHGLALQTLGQMEKALVSHQRALQLGGDDAVTLSNQAAALSYVGRPREAVASLQRVLALSPEFPFGCGNLVYSRMLCCDWRHFERAAPVLESGVAEGKRICTPFALLAVSDSPEAHLQCARIYLSDRCQTGAPSPVQYAARPAGGKISVAYLSADFRDHATSHLLAGLLERHDRSSFELTALSGSGDDGSRMRRRIEAAFDRFIGVDQQDDRAVAELIRRLNIDILVDLSGFVTGARPGLLAQRAAPIQVNYLGYPGTLGAPYVDYIIADAHVLSPESRQYFSEKVVYLPECYQPIDDRRPIADSPPIRVEAGLPQDDFVFCCFNANFKITPEVFDIWMRLLRAVEGSVLWLYQSNPEAPANLRAESQRRGVAPERLVFAERVSQAQHLARHALADLFLDTVPYNAHTTASDALWAGLPVLTCTGRAFPGRVAGSVLKAAGLPELVTADLQAYEARALELATVPGMLAQLRSRLLRNRHTHPLFDTDRYRRHLEAAYRSMHERWQQGEAPSDLIIRASDQCPVRFEPYGRSSECKG